MYISQIVLRDWKAYASALFEFPAPTAKKNIVLIGAPNGYGKTSLFEAIVLGIFGRDGLNRAGFAGGSNS
jgi:DNA sulfur modification protein DndD